MHIKRFIKRVLEHVLPRALLRALNRLRSKRIDMQFRDQSARDVFSAVYKSGVWGGMSNDFYSGTGSRDAGVTDPYVYAVADWLRHFVEPPSVVDLGCGDFHVGKQIRDLCGQYVACDVVPELIERNTAKYRDLGVHFKCIDITRDSLPSGDVVFIRQVLQHLSNAQIKNVVSGLARYKYVVLSEHLPLATDFEPNLDKVAGPKIRLGVNSGVVLTAAPFHFRVEAEHLLCSVPESGGIVKTLVYQVRTDAP